MDGVRGIAIALVVAGHTLAPVYGTAGYSGVAVFFVLSGYLITSILVREHARTGRISLRAFYARRARRLLPALLVYLVAGVVLGTVFNPGYGTVANAWPALFYVANLNRMYEFGDLGGLLRDGGFAPLWSLSIEEQFYLVFPMILIALLAWLGGRAALRWLLVLAGASLALRVALWAGGAASGRIYFGTDTTACLLLAGCALAVWRRGPRVPAWLVTPALAAIPLLGLWEADGRANAAFAPMIAGALTVVAIAGVSGFPSRVPAWLTCRPLVLLGQRSYALYLWHAPAMLTWRFAGGGLIAWIACVGLAWTVTLLSWRYVESPFLRTNPRPRSMVGRRDQHHRDRLVCAVLPSSPGG